MLTKARRFLAPCLVIVSCLLPLEAAHAAQTKVRVGYNPASDFLAAFVAKDQGFFEKRGIDAEFSLLQSQQAIIGALVSGSADVGATTPITILLADEAGIPINVVAAADVLPTKAKYGILARTGSGIKTAHDLIGKKIGLPGLKAMLHLIGQRWMVENGVKPEQVTLIETPFPQMSDLLKSGQIDAVLTADPFYTRILDQQTGYAFDDIYKTVPDGTLLAGYISPRPWVETHADALNAFRAALRDAITYINANEASARDTLAKWTKLPPEVIAKTAIPNLDVDVSARQMQWFIDAATAEHMVEGTSAADKLVAR